MINKQIRQLSLAIRRSHRRGRGRGRGGRSRGCRSRGCRSRGGRGGGRGGSSGGRSGGNVTAVRRGITELGSRAVEGGAGRGGGHGVSGIALLCLRVFALLWGGIRAAMRSGSTELSGLALNGGASLGDVKDGSWAGARVLQVRVLAQHRTRLLVILLAVARLAALWRAMVSLAIHVVLRLVLAARWRAMRIVLRFPVIVPAFVVVVADGSRRLRFSRRGGQKKSAGDKEQEEAYDTAHVERITWYLNWLI